MTMRAYVERDYGRFSGIRIHLSRRFNDGRYLLAEFEDVVMREVDEPLAATADAKPLRVDEETARALYEALSQYFGGTHDAATLRKDYDAERARVDLFLAHMTNGGRP